MARRSPAERRRQRWLDYPVQGAALWALFALFRMLPVDRASALGGRIARLIGPRLGASRKALRNVERAMPEIAEEERRRIVAGMWDNLGRVAAEYPHLARIAADPDRVEVVGTENLARGMRDRPAILFSAHLANWELLMPTARRLGMTLTLVYRRPNNPVAARLIDRLRGGGDSDRLVPKGRRGAKALVDTLRRGDSIALLVDQKLNRGVAVPFFGRDAMTTPAPAEFAMRFGASLIPVRIERLEGVRFRVEILPPLVLPDGDGRKRDPLAVTARMNALIESWIRERPEQWLWLHRRWGD
jgi:KDO2-lipid IV(A) lauroyltransferase